MLINSNTSVIGPTHFTPISSTKSLKIINGCLKHSKVLYNRILPYLIIKTIGFPHCSDCLQLENIALCHLTTTYSRLNGVNNCCEMPPEHYQLNKKIKC